LIMLGLWATAWLLWSTVTLNSLGTSIPIFNLVPPARAAQTVGFLAVPILAIVLSKIGRVSVPVAVGAAVSCTFITLYAGSSLIPTMPSMSPKFVILASAVVFAIVLGLSLRPTNRIWLTAAGCAAVLTVFAANPVIFGLGDLRGTPAASYLEAQGKVARGSDSLWVSNAMDLDGLLIATGVPTLSGHQVTGPVRSEWLKLDPTAKYEGIWNRGTSYLEFQWTTDNTPQITIGSTPDQIVVTVNPCRLNSLGFKVSGLLTRDDLDLSCLTPERTVTWGGAPARTYRVR
jgi:hypothetical protein